MNRDWGRTILGRKMGREIFLPIIFLPPTISGSRSQGAASHDCVPMSGRSVAAFKNFPDCPGDCFLVPQDYIPVPEDIRRVLDEFYLGSDDFLPVPDDFVGVRDDFVGVPDDFFLVSDDFLDLSDDFLPISDAG